MQYVSRVLAHLFLNLDIDSRESQALHKCNNPKCVNLEHIYVGTECDNWQDRKQAHAN